MKHRNCVGFINYQGFSLAPTAKVPAVLVAPDLVITASQNIDNLCDLEYRDDMIFRHGSSKCDEKTYKVSCWVGSNEFKLLWEGSTDLALLRLDE